MQIPEFLNEYINALDKAKSEGKLYDIEQCELLAAINQALMAHYIDERTAKELRVKYIGDYYA